MHYVTNKSREYSNEFLISTLVDEEHTLMNRTPSKTEGQATHSTLQFDLQYTDGQ